MYALYHGIFLDDLFPVYAFLLWRDSLIPNCKQRQQKGLAINVIPLN